MTLPGVGAVTATALVASIAAPAQFNNGRQLAAWLGLHPSVEVQVNADFQCGGRS